MPECLIVPPSGGAKNQARFVVLVDADAHLLFTLAMLLQRFSYHVCTAKTGEEAWEMIAVAVPSLVVTELALPGMSGLDLLHRLRQDPRTQAVPVIALTGDGAPEVRIRSVRAGFAACLQRPIAAEELYRVVQHAVEPTPRSNIRVYTRLPVTVSGVALACGGGECASVLSEHGMYIRTLAPSPVNTVLALRFTLNGRVIALEAVVLYGHRFGEGPFGEPGMGLKFLRISAEDEEHIRRFIRDEVTQGIEAA
ncbi:MAG: response regulator [Nitrospirota bacterium]